ncbi:sulfurtransferase TusA family protein [Hathewaya histolytica]|uniref:sulfurtransferase TusA family protein n=1 Tax=Hathewaya histolytica TaxID=1498 RepID=UPI003B66E37B
MVKKVNCLGDFCPIPSIKAKQTYKKLKKYEKAIILTDHSCAPSNIRDSLKNCNCNIEIDEVMEGIYEITIEKLY